MREIKFRGYEPAKREWIVSPGFLLFPDGKITLKVDENEEGNLVTSPINAETLGQFTGLKDINRNDIFEGDLLEHPNSGIFEVKFEDYGFYLFHNGVKQINHVTEHMAIIGNIHDNPYLIK